MPQCRIEWSCWYSFFWPLLCKHFLTTPGRLINRILRGWGVFQERGNGSWVVGPFPALPCPLSSGWEWILPEGFIGSRAVVLTPFWMTDSSDNLVRGRNFSSDKCPCTYEHTILSMFLRSPRGTPDTHTLDAHGTRGWDSFPRRRAGRKEHPQLSMQGTGWLGFALGSKESWRKPEVPFCGVPTHEENKEKKRKINRNSTLDILASFHSRHWPECTQILLFFY